MRYRWLVLRNLRSFAVYAAQDDGTGMVTGWVRACYPPRTMTTLPQENESMLTVDSRLWLCR
jgi:hypothetical protein